MQITLSAEDQRRARNRARDLGISFAEYVRRLIARDLGGTEVGAHPSALFDLGDSGGSDIAREKRTYLGQAFEDRR